jgi:ubiquinone biosynthesis monooxygenase Coq7
MQIRHFSFTDKILAQADQAMKTIFADAPRSSRPNPGEKLEEADLQESDKQHIGGLMRVNHSGEVSAQGLYQGQALTARLPDVREKMEQAAIEENDHLAWCEERLNDVHSRKSLLNPVWYAGSFVIGAVAGAVGDKWSLGFVAETEHQVVKHLDEHLDSLPEQDQKTRAILVQMKKDELHHATTALHHGGADLPLPAKKLMGLMSKVMTRTAYWV